MRQILLRLQVVNVNNPAAVKAFDNVLRHITRKYNDDLVLRPSQREYLVWLVLVIPSKALS